MFQLLIFLSHFNKSKPLYIEVDVFKKKEFNMMTYHVKRNLKLLNEFSVFTLMKSILFLSKLLTSAEMRY